MAEMEGNGTPPTDTDLQEAVVSLLQGTWDLNSITLNTIKTSMEEKFQCSLLERKAVMKQALTSFLEDEEAARAMEADQPIAAAGAEDGDDDEEQDDEHEPRRGEDKKRKRSGGGFTALVQLSTELAEFLGEVSIPRTQVTKRLWAYIKEKGLQNPKDKREILNDEAMQKIFKAKKMTMFSMNKLLASHLKSLKDLQDGKGEDEEDDDDEEDGDEDEDGEARPKKRAASSSSSSSSSSSKPKPKAKAKAKPKTKAKAKTNGEEKKKKSGGGFTAPVQLSTELAEFLGEVSMPRTEVSKRLWAYIKEKGLQNPEDKREILNDEAMQKIFKAKKMTMFSMNKLLSSGNHLKSLKDLQDGKGGDGKKDEDEEDEKEEEGEDEDDGETRPKKAASKPKAKPKAKPKKPQDVDEDGDEGEDSEDERT